MPAGSSEGTAEGTMLRACGLMIAAAMVVVGVALVGIGALVF